MKEPSMCDQFYFICDDCHRSTSGHCWRHPKFNLVNAAAGAAMPVTTWQLQVNAGAAMPVMTGMRVWLDNNMCAAAVPQTLILNLPGSA
jgi:hypothetical protein